VSCMLPWHHAVGDTKLGRALTFVTSVVVSKYVPLLPARQRSQQHKVMTACMCWSHWRWIGFTALLCQRRDSIMPCTVTRLPL
jgi:hypothetical protein